MKANNRQEEKIARLRDLWEVDAANVQEFRFGDKLVVLVERGDHFNKSYDVLRYFTIGDEHVDVSQDKRGVTIGEALTEIRHQVNAADGFRVVTINRLRAVAAATLSQLEQAHANEQGRIDAMAAAHSVELQRREQYAATLAERLEAAEAQLRLSSYAVQLHRLIAERLEQDNAVGFCPSPESVVVWIVAGATKRHRLYTIAPDVWTKAPDLLEALQDAVVDCQDAWLDQVVESVGQ